MRLDGLFWFKSFYIAEGTFEVSLDFENQLLLDLI